MAAAYVDIMESSNKQNQKLTRDVKTLEEKLKLQSKASTKEKEDMKEEFKMEQEKWISLMSDLMDQSERHMIRLEKFRKNKRFFIAYKL